MHPLSEGWHFHYPERFAPLRPSRRTRPRELPHLVLYRDGALSDAVERTLLVAVSGLEVPGNGLEVTLEVASMHRDPDRGDEDGRPIVIWRASRRIANTTGVTRTNVETTFVHTFSETVASVPGTIPTPTDYLRCRITMSEAEDATEAAHELNQEYAALIENQWTAPLPKVAEDVPGAAPDELVVYYCDMIPFRRSVHEPATWLPRIEVTDYVGTKLIPRMTEAFRVQGDDWGFPWHEAWISYRGEERSSVALTDGQTWYHGASPSGGHSAISLTVSGGNNVSFATLTDGLLSTLHHELFHNWQRSVHLLSGGNGDVAGARDAWQFFSEGTAVLASSVGQSRGQFVQRLPARTYMGYANGFVWRGGGREGGLNVSYEDMDPYQVAIYWRFLYEQCGGGEGRPAVTGMQVIQSALVVLYSGHVVDIGSSTDLVTALPKVMDPALAGWSCPFQTYEGSLLAFASAIGDLCWQQGPCTVQGICGGCGFYDPHGQFHKPPASTVSYAGTTQTYEDQIGTSFGIDLIEIQLGPPAGEEPLVIEFRPAAGSVAEFSVEIWHGAAQIGVGAVVEARPGSAEELTYLVPASDGRTPAC